MKHASVKAIILPEIIKLIAEKYNVSLDEAMDRFYLSKTGEAFSDEETDLFSQSPLYIFGLFESENRK